MKRFWTLVAVLLCLTAVTAFAHSTLTIKPSEMKDGETKVLEDDGRTITIKRDGDTINVKIEGAGKTKNLTIVGADGGLRIERDGHRAFVFSPGELRDRIQIEGIPLPPDLDKLPRYRSLPREKMQSWFVCPKDKTMLRVPEDAKEKEFKCPVDGTVMEKRRASGFHFFFGDDEERHDL